MNRRFIVFISAITAILGGASFYVGVRIISRFEWAFEHRGAVWAIFTGFVALQILSPYLYRVFPNSSHRLFPIFWAGYASLGLFACLFFYTLSTDVFLALWSLFSGPGTPADLDRRGFLLTCALTVGTVIIGAVQALGGPCVYEVEIPLAGLPEPFDGLRIVQISDLHVGPTIGRRYTEKVVRLTHSLRPDIVALTGDFVDGTPDRLREGVKPLAGLRAPLGVYFVPGNHEYYWGAVEWIEEFRKMEARPLLNEHVVIRKGGQELVLAGVTDHAAGGMVVGHASSPKKSLEGATASAVKILLAHQPASYAEASAAGFDLQLSGHTHGGQFFPWSIAVKLAQRYFKGLYRHEKMWVYVSRGTGYWGPPIRFGVPSEITAFTLRRVRSST